VDFVRRWSEQAEIGVGRFIPWLGVTASKFYDWRRRYGCVNEHNGWVPRDFWLELWEKEAIIEFHLRNPLEGYRRLTFMMLDADVVAVSWESMREADVEVILQRAKEKYPEAKPRIISDNGPQFIARDFKEFIRVSGMTHVRTSPYYPQSNGKIERWHKSLKSECIRPGTPLSLEDAQRLVHDYVEHYNNVRLNSATGYITPKDMLAGRQQEIHAERDRKLEAARQQRQSHRQQAA
jgi:transposase InsO family protein